jgi:CMP-N-acetylneuraminic acid synthetase
MSEFRDKIIALLPMKAHSARVSEKNFRDFNGKPLFRWILDALLEIPEIRKVVINTDAREILREKGLVDSRRIQIRDRNTNLRGDFVSMNRILEDDVKHVPADVYLMTHTTNPLLKTSTIREALEAFEQGRKMGTGDSLFAVNRVQTRFYREDGTAVNHDPSKLIRTQDLEPWFEENSNLYIFTAESFEQTKARIGKRPILFETPKLESVDIDGPEDWNLALALAKAREGSFADVGSRSTRA